MGQSPSSHSPWPPGSAHRRSTTLTSYSSSTRSVEDVTNPIDYTSFIPDDILAIIFHHLDSNDRKRCSLVSRRWLLVEGRSRYRLTLIAQWAISPYLSRMFSRFSSVTKLTLRCSRNYRSVDDYGLTIASAHCPRLMRLKLRGCNNITELGMAALAKHCKQLKKFSCGSCYFAVQAMNALLDNCSSLEELSVKRLRIQNNNETTLELIGPGLAASSIKRIHLNDVCGFFFEPLISGSKKLQSLKVIRCMGRWDSILESVVVPGNNIIEVHLERLLVSDDGISALSNCPHLQVLHIVKVPDCTNAGVIAVAESCHYLRKLCIDGWKMDRIGDDALVAIGTHLVHLEELILIGVKPTGISLLEIAVNCKKLERLALCGCDTVYDSEVLCIGLTCVALKLLCITGCPVSDHGIRGFAYLCPNLEKITVKDCRYVSGGIGDWLRARRESLEVYLDDEPGTVVATANESGAQEEVVEAEVEVEVPAITNHAVDAQPEPVASSSSGRRSFFKTRFGVFSRRGLGAYAFGRRSGGNSSSSGAV